jgi:NAD(P)-dependent dehydrogenase (short-subunit alcohol dehydrogenase family)
VAPAGEELLATFLGLEIWPGGLTLLSQGDPVKQSRSRQSGFLARPGWLTFAAAGAGYFLWKEIRARSISLTGQVVLVTGGSRGLGLLLAREFAREGCQVAICARDLEELERARLNLANHGFEVFTAPCDVADRVQVEALIATVARRFGRLDILVNNAGVIQVGPVASMNVVDFQQAMAVNFWGMVYASLAAAAEMKDQGGGGRIVNITSIGGTVAVPHLLPYDCAKFAAFGFSEGLGVELARDKISVTTVVPSLLRTGSYTHAMFKGHQESEFGWFSFAASKHLTTLDARRAARRIVKAAKLRAPELVLGWQVRLLRLAKSLFPGALSRMLVAINRLLPAPNGDVSAMIPGRLLAEARKLREL